MSQSGFSPHGHSSLDAIVLLSTPNKPSTKQLPCKHPQGTNYLLVVPFWGQDS
jgi:hypothetical protein